MITDKTVFILGAGSNHVYGFPTGSELLEYIIIEFKGDLKKNWNTNKIPPHPESYQYFIFHSHPELNEKRRRKLEESAQEFIDRFKTSSNPSIDLFLSRTRSLKKLERLRLSSKY
ncbi:MAG: hypothetical protein JSV31_29420 [Desulfobacterales bacterium]|nr:MAG: hypothetical protein JSV31_29420 [Desulfobacterales bacterium]